jgi:hypothetical protein
LALSQTLASSGKAAAQDGIDDFNRALIAANTWITPRRWPWISSTEKNGPRRCTLVFG